MTRVLSALVLLPVVLGTIWYLPPAGTLTLVVVAAALAFAEFRGLAAQLGARVPAVLGGVAVVASAVALGLGEAAIEVELAALIAVGAAAVAGSRPGPTVLADVAATLLAPLYIGLPLGALAAVRAAHGREALLALVATIVVSDSAQYYVGRLAGRRPLAPAISPKKTVAGAVGGFVAGALCLAIAGRFWLPALDWWLAGAVGAMVALLGMAGDLFESLLKRSAGVKDSSGLIPGHGGMLDRLDSWLFAAPAYYVFLRHAL